MIRGKYVYYKNYRDFITTIQNKKVTDFNYKMIDSAITVIKINKHLKIDSTAKNLQHQQTLEPAAYKIQNTSNFNQNRTLILSVSPDSLRRDSLATAVDSPKQIIMLKPVEMFQLLNAEKSKFNYKPLKVFIEKNKTDFSPAKSINFEPNLVHQSHLNWTLILGLICISLILGLKKYYQKFMDQIVNTMINFQLAEKILREKNILARRAFFMLNLNYLLIFSLFILLVFISINFNITSKYYFDYLIITIGVLSLMVIRLGIIYLNGYLFQMMPATLEYIHNIYLINKNLGIILLPLMFASIYTPHSLSKILLIGGFVFVSLATLFKIIRGFQIIMKNGVLLFYSILYLCTLELLPLVLGSKILIALR